MYRKYRSRAWAERKFSLRRKIGFLVTVLISSAFLLHFASAQVDTVSVSLSQPNLINTVTNLTNLIQNPSLETSGVNGNPEGWLRGGWGINNRTHIYPVAGTDGVRAARVQITSYTNGDAKWYFKNVLVTPGKTYRLSHKYKSNVTTQLLASYQTLSGPQYFQLGMPSPSTNWAATSVTFTVPQNVTSMSVFHLLMSVGTLDIDAFSLSVQEVAITITTPPASLASPYPALVPVVSPRISFSLSPVSGSQPTSYAISPQPLPTALATPMYQPTPAAVPSSVIVPTTGKQVILNAVNWGYNPLQNLPLNDISQANYFVLETDAAGNLEVVNANVEAKFVSDVHAKGKKATLSLAGGTQNIADITSALTTNKNAFIANIVAHMNRYGYDGVVLDVENTWLAPSVIPTFIKQLRAAMGTKPILGVFVQHWQLTTVYGQLQDSADSITWVAPMIYDFWYTMSDLKSLTLEWLPKVKGNNAKLFAGVAVNYPTGLNVEQYKEILRWTTDQKLGGVAVWQNNLFAQPWLDAQRSVWPIVK